MKTISLLAAGTSLILMLMYQDDTSLAIVFGVVCLFNYLNCIWMDITDKIEGRT